MSYRIAVIEWVSEEDGLPQVISDELTNLGHHPLFFPHKEEIPVDIDVVLSFGPYGDFLPIGRKLSRIPKPNRPIWAHWNTEGLPDILMPWFLMRYLGAIRSNIGQLAWNDKKRANLIQSLLDPWKNRALRYRYVGDYYYAYNRGILNVFADSSAIYAQIHRHHGLPTVIAPWGATPMWFSDLNLDRDIDVLWIGQRGSSRRSRLLDLIREQLQMSGVEIYMADNLENPFVFGKERTKYFNRAKITLNLTRTWFDDNFSRFAMAAPNHSLIVSEPLLPHCPHYISGKHYISAPHDKLAETIMDSLVNDEKRGKIVNNAYELVTTELAFQNSIRKIMAAVNEEIKKKF